VTNMGSSQANLLYIFFNLLHIGKNFSISPHQNDQGRKGPGFFQRLIALKCLKCQKIKKNV
jgi:hypothetical protein